MAEDVEKRKLKEIISQLEKIKGRHTELVTVYIPAGFNLVKVVDQIRTEQSTAMNIKSKTVKKNVMAALETILQHLKLYKQTPPNGLVLFAGNISEKEGVADIEIFAIEPPEPVKNKLYWCGQNFILDPLKEIFSEKEIYGLVLIDRSEAEIGLLIGKKIEPLKHMESLVPGKTKAGGWSQARYARIREGLLNDFLKKVGDTASQLFKEQKNLRAIIVGGPGPIKEQFIEGQFLEYDIKKKILGTVNTTYTGEFGLKEAVDKADEILKEAAAIREKKLLERYFNELGKGALGVYGLEPVVKALESGNVEILLLSEDIDWVKAKFKCSCGKKEEKIMKDEGLLDQECSKCGNTLEFTSKKSIIDELINKTEDYGGKAEMISGESPMGLQFKELGGIGAILRYKQ